ncbi:MAG: HAMP domain-containing histidine kinase [Culturomica sp.]|jgi:two-component system phosphate regulon sensor histidine kinase PhoR|nr:HAMP domain-containing histidine kinase [Culturomica sp.]
MRKRQLIILGVVVGLSLVGLIFLQGRYLQTAFTLRKTQFDFAINKSLDEVIAQVEEQDAKNEREAKSREEQEHKIRYREQKQPLRSAILNRPVLEWSERGQSEDDFLWQKNPALMSSIHKAQQGVKDRLGSDFSLQLTKIEPEKSVEDRIRDIDLKTRLEKCLRENGIQSDFEFAVKEDDRFLITSSSFLNHPSQLTYNKPFVFGGVKSQAGLFVVFPDKLQQRSSVWLVLPSCIITLLLVLCFVFCLIVIIRQKKLSVIKNDFINNMTHEFKTPIATISLASQMMKDGAVQQTPESIDHIAGIIRDESKRLTYQVEKVLQTALFTEKRMKLKLKNVSLNEIVESMLIQFSLRVEDKGGQLTGHLDADRDEIYADEVHLTNVVSNLLDNALKYCIRVPEINVYTRNREDEIIISVIDNGIGIAAKEQKLIFERFYRVSTGNLHDVKGFGLGLSYVKTIVEAHGGQIVVESALDKGSRFDVILPLESKKQKVKRTLFF